MSLTFFIHIQVDKVGRKLLATVNVHADICATTTHIDMSARLCSHMQRPECD